MNLASASPRISARPGYDQSANAVSSIASAIVASSRPFLPDANSAATTLPADVPTSRSGTSPFSSSAWMTPMWAKPRAAPPPSARPIRDRRGGAGGGATIGEGADAADATGATPPVVFGALEQPATPRAPSEPIAQAPARVRNTSRRAHGDR